MTEFCGMHNGINGTNNLVYWCQEKLHEVHLLLPFHNLLKQYLDLELHPFVSVFEGMMCKLLDMYLVENDTQEIDCDPECMNCI